MPQRDRPNPKIQGENHWNWQGGKAKIRRDRNSVESNIWRDQVFRRDNYTCKWCGVTTGKTGSLLHPHHIRPYRDNEELRYVVSNGITLCVDCHLKTFGKEELFVEFFSALVANGVNCGEAQPSDVEGNPQPSLGGNTGEGSETRGRDYGLGELEPLRSVMVPCDQCGKMHKKPPCRLKLYVHQFCSAKCKCGWWGEMLRKNHPNRKPKTEVECAWCGKKVLLAPWQVARGSINHFCCPPHYWLWKKGKPPKLRQ